MFNLWFETWVMIVQLVLCLQEIPQMDQKMFMESILSTLRVRMLLLGHEHLNHITIKAKKDAKVSEASMEESMPKVYSELFKILKKLEKHYKDMQDVEFTVENNKLWILQTRSGKRTSKSAVKIAVDMVKESLSLKMMLF